MSCVGDSILQEYDETNANDYENWGTSGHAGQSFQIQADATICGASWYGGKGVASGSYKFELLSDSYASGTVIAATGTVLTDSLSVYTSPDWVKLEFTATVDLLADTTYFMKLTPLSGSSNDVLRWARDTSPTYPLGILYASYGAGSGRDRIFRIHGVAGGGGGGQNSSFLKFM